MNEPVAIYVPSGRDARAIEQILRSADIGCVLLGPTALIARIADFSLAAAVMTEEAVVRLPRPALQQCLGDQPAWSDFPFVVPVTRGIPTSGSAAVMRIMGNVARIERPVHPVTLIGAVRAALRARARQRDAQRYLAERERAENKFRLLAQTLEQRVADRTSALVESNRLLAAEMAERRDTQERMQQMQAQLVHVSRVSAMGAMASTLAHELNQPLTAVINYVRGSKRMLESGGADHLDMIVQALDAAGDSAYRAGEIVRHLREFVARGEVKKQPENLARLIDDAAALGMIDAAAHGVTCRLALDPDATMVLVDRIQIEQVLINLMRNAMQAMEDSAVRKIVIASSRKANGMIEVSVTDTGKGMSQETLARLFSPFTSTKGEGLGIGLSISRTIIEANGGTIGGGNVTGGGAVFRFILPAFADDNMVRRTPASG